VETDVTLTKGNLDGIVIYGRVGMNDNYWIQVDKIMLKKVL
jgi:hypothetical protein